MRRSSSKLITRARSLRNVSKVPFKFKFDLLIETVDKLAAHGDVVVIWERSNNKVHATKAVKIDKNTRKASFNNEKIATDITLFKSQPSERRFQEKVVKLAVKQNNADGKTLGKIHLNLADYAEVPSGSKRISAELTNGAVLIATVQCQFLSMGKTIQTKPGKSETNESSQDEEDLDDDMESECNSVAVDETPTGFLKSKLKIARVGSKKLIGRTVGKTKADEENNMEVANTVDQQSFEQLRKENQRLRKQLEEAECNAGLTGDAKRGDVAKSLRNEVRELRNALAREPIYADVVKELKEAKMALALLHLEKEEVLFELMKYQRGEKSPRNSL
ncbi:hypothetical protein FGB62_58g116 [Gracilaria domingensis]|nr:hypothetical protein FGB62_58g116 [Gracilaria domingensis]